MIRKILLLVLFRYMDNARTEHITFDIVDTHYPYNAILGRGFINKFHVVFRKLFLCMKKPDPKGVIRIYGDFEKQKKLRKGLPQVRRTFIIWPMMKKKEALCRGQRETKKRLK